MPYPTNLDNRSVNDIVVPSLARTVSGNSGVLTPYGAGKDLIAQLNVTAAAGTTPTLNVTIQDTLDGVNFYPIATFTQAVAAGAQVIRYQGAFTDQLQVSWTIGGTTPSFTFEVRIFAKR